MERFNSIHRPFFFLVILGISLSNCTCTDNAIKDDPIVFDKDLDKIIIQAEQAKTRFENYGEHRGKIIEIYENNGRRFGDSVPQNQQYSKDKKQDVKAEGQNVEKGFVPVQYTYYEYEKFKKYLKFIEQETKKAGADISTIRIYFANYPENEPEDEEDYGKRKRNTVMFVPTIKIDGNESAYYISNDGPEGIPRPYIITDSFVKTKKTASMGSLDIPRNTNEASLLPNFNSSLSPSLFYADQSVIGNEGSRNPPR